jgi:hypothetical protein
MRQSKDNRAYYIIRLKLLVTDESVRSEDWSSSKSWKKGGLREDFYEI